MSVTAPLPPISPLSEPPDWARLPIEERGDALVALANGEGNLQVRALYAEMKIPHAPQTIWVRDGVHQRLLRAASFLQERDAVLVVFDGYRPLTVQQYLYDTCWADTARARPELSDEALTAQVRQFVAAPNPDPTCPPPHRTGGAVDVYLLDWATGAELPMGTEPDAVVPASATRTFEETLQEPFTTNRRLLYHAMVTVAGFSNYRGEWWHYDYGNQRWANVIGASHALYGIPREEI